MNQPTPAIVAQSAVRRLPRWGLLLFCAIYILAGFVWRDPWKGDDITSFGYMLELARGHASWLKPGMLGESANFHTLLPYWLGAWAIQISPAWMTASQAVRLVFMAVLALTLLGCWFSIYYLARSRAAQPVSFAFGGEARPADYARAIADGGLLATKPYVSAAAYLHRMSDHCGQCRYRRDLRTGARACPFNALYWDFLARHAPRLQHNPRLALPYRQLARMPAGERQALAQQAMAELDLTSAQQHSREGLRLARLRGNVLFEALLSVDHIHLLAMLGERERALDLANQCLQLLQDAALRGPVHARLQLLHGGGGGHQFLEGEGRGQLGAHGPCGHAQRAHVARGPLRGLARAAPAIFSGGRRLGVRGRNVVNGLADVVDALPGAIGVGADLDF